MGNMSSFLKNFYFCIFVLVIGVTLTILLSRKIPIENDEHIQYSTFSCNYYNYANNNKTYHDSCHQFDLALLKDIFYDSPYLPLRSYYYVGSIGSIFYIPIWFFWKSPFNVRLVGFLMLGIQAFFIERIFRFNKYFVFIFLITFLQYSSQHIFDLGQLSFQCTSIFILYYLIINFFNQYKLKKIISYGISIGLLLFIGLWERLSYSFFLPGISIIIIYFIIKNLYTHFYKFRNIFIIKNYSIGLLTLTLSFLIPTFILLTAKDIHNQYYYKIITNNTPNNAIYDVKETYSHFNNKLKKFLLDPTLTISPEIQFQRYPNLTPYQLVFIDEKDYYNPRRGFFALLNWLPFILLFVPYVSKNKALITDKKLSKNAHKYLSFVLLFATFITLYIISTSPASWNMHHVVLAYPFIILLLLNMYSLYVNKFLKILLLCIFFIFQSYLIFIFYNQKNRLDFDKNIPYIIDNINKFFDKSSVIVHTEWNIFFIHSSIGKDKTHTVIWNNTSNIKSTLKLAKDTNKNLIYISSKDSDILYHLKNKFKKRHNLELKILKHPKYKLGNYIIGYVKVVNNH